MQRSITGCVIPQCDYIWSSCDEGSSGGILKVLVVGSSCEVQQVCVWLILDHVYVSDLWPGPLYVPLEDSVECKAITAQLLREHAEHAHQQLPDSLLSVRGK